jgi:hypothetical protein
MLRSERSFFAREAKRFPPKPVGMRPEVSG